MAAIAGALLFTAACYWILAPWQFHRHQQQDVQNSAVLSAVAADAVPLADQLSTVGQPGPGLAWRRVTLSGRYEPAGQVYSLLRQDNSGAAADEVIVPFRLADGSVVMIDRGYFALTDLAAGKLPAQLPDGPVDLTARVQADWPYPKPKSPVHNGGRTEVYGVVAVDIASLTHTAGPVRNGYLQLTDGDPGALETVALPQVDDGPFLSYALQWLGFGAMAILGLGFFIYREAYHPLADQDDEEFSADATGTATSSDAAESPVTVGTLGTVGTVGTGATETEMHPQPGVRKGRQRARFDKATLYDAPDEDRYR